jgi:hypothetical protein
MFCTIIIYELKQRRVDICKELGRRFEQEGDDFLTRLVTWDEIWVHYHITKTKRAIMEWRHSSSPKIRKGSDTTICMLTLFWDQKGVILEHYRPMGNTVTSASSYSDLLRPAIKTK